MSFQVWSLIEFNPQNFEITEVEYDDTETLDNTGGDRKVLETVHFPRQFDGPKMLQSESDQFSVVRIRNFPLEISDEEIATFLQEKVDKEISVDHIKSEKTKYSTNIYLGPGPSLSVVAKATEVLDYKTTAKTFFEDRKLHIQLHRPLTPDKVEKQEENQSRSISRIPKDTVKAAIKDINNVKPVPATPKSRTDSNTNGSSGLTSAISRHKDHFK